MSLQVKSWAIYGRVLDAGFLDCSVWRHDRLVKPHFHCLHPKFENQDPVPHLKNCLLGA